MADVVSRARHVSVTLDLEHAPDVPWPWGPNHGEGDGWIVPAEITLGYTRWPRGGRITVTARIAGLLRDPDGTMADYGNDIELDRLPDGLPGWAQELADQNMPAAFQPKAQQEPTPCGERLGEAVCAILGRDHTRHVTAEGDFWFEADECPHDNCQTCDEPSLLCGATAEDGTACFFIAQHRKSGKPHTFEPTPSA